MAAPDSHDLNCACGASLRPSADGSLPATCPACGVETGTRAPASFDQFQDAQVVGLDKILLDKGWITPEQHQVALRQQVGELAKGRKIRFGEVLVNLGILKPEQVREALLIQGKLSMRCPKCAKTYNVKARSGGTGELCRVCNVPLAPLNLSDSVAADDSQRGLRTTASRPQMPVRTIVAAAAVVVGVVAFLVWRSGDDSPATKVAGARKAIEKNGEDPEANLILGRHLCFQEGDWDRGLAHLRKGSDPALKRLAEWDGTNPVAAGGRTLLADAWWERGEQESGDVRATLRRRAASWYSQAVGALSGAEKSRVEQRIEAARR